MTEENTKPMVDDRIDVLATEGETFTREEFLDKLTDLYNQNMHKAYEDYSVSMIRTKEFGWSLFFMGRREETKEETAKREAIEGAKQKTIEAAELKEYLRLHKKYGKKDK